MTPRSTARPFQRVIGVLALIAVTGVSAGCSGGDNSGAPLPATQPEATSPTAAGTSSTAPSSAPASTSSPSAAPPSPSASSPSASGSSSPTAGGTQQTAIALQAVATAQNEVRGGKVFDLEDDTERGQRIWSAKVVTTDDRQFNLAISQDGGQVLASDEDKTPDDDIRKLRAANVTLQDAIDTAAARGEVKGSLTSLEIDTDDNNTVVWQIEFGGDDGTTVLVDATSGKVLDVGPDVG